MGRPRKKGYKRSPARRKNNPKPVGGDPAAKVPQEDLPKLMGSSPEPPRRAFDTLRLTLRSARGSLVTIEVD